MRTVERFQYENKQMIWAAIWKKGKFPLHFIENGLKINAVYYKKEILEKILKEEGSKIYKKTKWTFQQDSAPAHKALIVQKWCKSKIPDFISTSEWPPSSPDLNPLDYSIWEFLESKVNSKRHTTLESLKASIQREWDNLPMKTVRSAIDSMQKVADSNNFFSFYYLFSNK